MAVSDDKEAVKALFEEVRQHYSQFPVTDIDGIKVDFPDGWVHLRGSNTEAILRIYAESTSPDKAQQYADEVIKLIS